METMDVGVMKSLDVALEEYLDASLEKIDKIMELLHKAEVEYTLSKAAKDKAKRDAHRAKGTIHLERAKELFLK